MAVGATGGFTVNGVSVKGSTSGAALDTAISVAASIAATANAATPSTTAYTSAFTTIQTQAAAFLTAITSQRGQLGATQNQLEYTVSNLTEFANNLSASRSRVMDTDYAAETANLTKGQILQQAATAMLAGLFAGGSVALREFRTVAAVMPVSAREAVAQVPTAGVPDRSVSVPVLLLPGDVQVRVGDAAAATLKRLGRALELRPPAEERGPHGVRETRALELGGTRFVLVVEPFERDAEPRIAAIYLQ